MDRECFSKFSLCSEQSTLNWSGQDKSDKSDCSLEQSIPMATRGVRCACVCVEVCVCVCVQGVRVSLCVSVCVCVQRGSCVSDHHRHTRTQTFHKQVLKTNPPDELKIKKFRFCRFFFFG